MRRLFAPALLLAAGCAPVCPSGSSLGSDGLCYLPDGSDAPGATPGAVSDDDGGADGADGADAIDDGGDDTGEAGGQSLGFVHGDPIVTLNRAPVDGKVEWVDVALIDDDHAIVVGQAGWEIVDRHTGDALTEPVGAPLFRVDSDGQTVAMADRWGMVRRLDVSDPSAPVALPSIFRPGEESNEDVAVDGDLTLVGWTGDGALLFGPEGAQLGRIPGEHVFAVDLVGDRAVVTDGGTVGLWDVSDPWSPSLLSEALLAGEGRDVSFDGAHVVVALGGVGADVFAVEGDALVARGHVDLPGSVTGVAVDGEYAWLAAWSSVGLVWLGEGGPALLGLEDAAETAFGVAAAGGEALATDWNGVDALRAVPGVAGPELEVPPQQWFEPGVPVALQVRNYGLSALDAELVAPAGFSVEPAWVSVAPGGLAVVVVTPPDEAPSLTALTLTSNDVDEPLVSLPLRRADADVASVHGSLRLQGFDLPDPGLSTYALDEQRGTVVLLVYWSMLCPMCSMEIPDVQQSLADAYDAEDVVVWLVNTDADLDETRRFLTSAGLTVPCLLDPEQTWFSSYDRSGLGEEHAPYPFQVLIDQSGVIRHVTNTYDPADMRSRIDALLAD